MSDDSKFRKIAIHGIEVNISSMPQALTEVETLILSQQPHYVCFFEGNLFSLALGSSELCGILNQASLVFPDGIAVTKSMRYRHGLTVPRVSGPSFLLQACEHGVPRQWKHFFYGGAEGVAEKLVEQLLAKYPGLQVAGVYCPPFRPLTEAEETEVKSMIERSGADLLWVGLGGPKQEYWMSQHLGKINVPVMLGVGAAFDFHSGNRPWAPPWIRKLGMEWLYRALSGGRKTFLRNVKCVSSVSMVLCRDLICGLLNRRRAHKVVYR